MAFFIYSPPSTGSANSTEKRLTKIISSSSSHPDSIIPVHYRKQKSTRRRSGKAFFIYSPPSTGSANSTEKRLTKIKASSSGHPDSILPVCDTKQKGTRRRSGKAFFICIPPSTGSANSTQKRLS